MSPIIQRQSTIRPLQLLTERLERRLRERFQVQPEEENKLQNYLQEKEKRQEQLERARLEIRITQ